VPIWPQVMSILGDALRPAARLPRQFADPILFWATSLDTPKNPKNIHGNAMQVVSTYLQSSVRVKSFAPLILTVFPPRNKAIIK
jgi:hypothetical protein